MISRLLVLRPALLAPLLIVALAGCPDIVVPPDALITCAKDGSCPTGTSCKENIDRCVPDTPVETQPPRITLASITPAAGRALTTFSVSFVVDEPLGLPPVVTLDDATQRLALNNSSGDVNDPAVPWVFSYVARGDEQPGEHALSVVVVDVWGNEQTAELPDPLTLDFEAPVISNPALGAFIGDVALSFTLGLQGATRLVVSGDLQEEQDLVVSGDSVDVDVTFLAGDGDKSLLLTASDAVGNVSALELELTLDSSLPFSRPTLRPRDGQTAVKNNDRVDVAGQVTAGARLVSTDLVDQDGTTIAAVTGVEVDALTGALSGSVNVANLGNASSLQLRVKAQASGAPSPDAQSLSNALVVDNVAPANVVCSLPARVVAANVSLSLSASDFVDVEVVGDVVEVRSFLPLVGAAVNLILSPGEGQKNLTARFRDQAHNLSECNATTLLDASPPVLSAVQLLPPSGQSAVRSSQSVTISALVDVADTTIVSARLLNQSFGFIANVPGVSVNGSSVSGSFVVDDLVGVVPAGLVLELQVSDQALNSLAVRSPQLNIDDDPPSDPVLSAPADSAVFNVNVNVAGCAGATEVAFSGDVADNDGVFVALPANDIVVVPLSAGQGTKVLSARCRDGAFNLSGTDSVTVNLTTDEVLSLPALTLPPGQSALKTGDTLVVDGVGEVGATVVALRLLNLATGVTVQNLLTSVVSIAADGDLQGSFVASGLVDGTNVGLELILNARGRNSIAADSRSAGVLVDLSVPAAPVPASLRLVENTAAANDPARLNEDVDNTLTLSGLAGAVVASDTVDLCADAACNSIIDSAVVSGTSFGATTFAHRVNHNVFVRAVDGAHNRSSTTQVAVPRLTFTSMLPAAANAADDVLISFVSNVALRSPPEVRVDGNAALLQSQTGNAFVFAYNTSGAEGDGDAVVRVNAEDGTTFAAGTIGTDATTTLLDFTAPIINAAKVVLLQNDPGSADTLGGDSAAVDDGIDAVVDIEVVGGIDGNAPTVVGALRAANADGFFAPISVGDNAVDFLTLRASDDAGNVSTLDLSNDRRAPQLSELLVPVAAKDNDVVSLRFRLVDAASSLQALPVVTVGGRVATARSGNATEDPVDESFVYEFVVDQNSDDEGRAAVSIAFVDDVGNPGSASADLVLDFTAPVARNTTPGDRSTWNLAPTALGTATDNDGVDDSGVADVLVSLQRCDSQSPCDGPFLDTVFDSPTAVFAPTTVINARGDWSLPFDEAQFISGQGYQLRVKVADLAGNQSAIVTRDFSYDDQVLPQPTALAATLVGSTVRLTWTAPLVAATDFNVYYDLKNSAAPPYAGTSVTAGDSPIAVGNNVLTFDVSGLDAGSYVFVVTGLDGANESAYSNEVDITLP